MLRRWLATLPLGTHGLLGQAGLRPQSVNYKPNIQVLVQSKQEQI